MLNRIAVTLFLLMAFGVYSTEVRYLDNSVSLVNWERINPIKWLDYGEWREAQTLKDQNPEWETMLRDRTNSERVGQLLDCVGNCLVYRGTGFFKGSYRSPVFEGDEIHTIGESYAWLFLVDGTLVRLSPETSITIREINISKEANFIHARINAGHVTWLARSTDQFKESELRDTDSLFLPLHMYEANPEAYEKKNENDDLYDLIAEKPTWQKHYQRLNDYIEKNNEGIENIKKTSSFIVLPNGTFYGDSLSGEFLVLIGGKSYAKFRSAKTLRLKNENAEPEDITFFYRGFENNQTLRATIDTWYEIEETGRNISYYQESSLFRVSSFLTERISSIYLAREMMLEKTKDYILNPDIDPLVLARDHGYRIWNVTKRHETKNEFELRFDFLKEYTRRVETTNLFVAAKFKRKLEDRGEELPTFEYSEKFFQRALESYYHKGKRALDYNTDREDLNSTKKELWKRMNVKRRD